MVQKVFIFSCSTFGGFQTIINVDNLMTVDEAIAKAVENLEKHLKHFYFNLLVVTLKERNYHIHNISNEQLRSLNGPFYICSHREDKL